ncbi:hypothetical protein J437_LFUL012772 [Ladona fulva]|uniref:N-acetyltransferase domain-containing protein n=1 Tax=Ladona fulva TaxID=123851 RepID=A0A8K0KSQ5_LADFU|nr:hypothetical protein J437_LFUL012772 [Ladona fulva]
MYDSFSIFCPVSRLDTLKLLAEEDVLIEWSRPIFLNFTHSQIVDKLEEYCSHRLGFVEKVRGDIYVCERGLARVHQERSREQSEKDGSTAEEGDDGTPKAKEEDVKEDESLLAEAQLRQLGPEHAAAIHSLYPANDMESVEVFERLIRALPAFGVFSSDGELAAWMVQSYYGAMFSMQTLPAFRRRGYGLLLARRLTSAVLARGYIPFVVIRPENSASQNLYSKLGFRRRYETVRAILRPKGWLRGSDGEEAVVPEGSGVGGEEELTEAEVPEGAAERSRGEAEVPEGD